MSNVDSHQVARGGCETNGCHCKEFVKGDEGPKCKDCKHAPAKHKDLNKGATPAPVVQQEAAPHPNPTPPIQQEQAVPQQQQPQPPFQPQQVYSSMLQTYMAPPAMALQPGASYSVPPNPGYPTYNMPQQTYQDQQQYMQMQFIPGQIQCKQCNCFYPEHTGACLSCFPRGNCKICSTNVVFMDLSMSHGLQMFDYCSPECRNNDLPRLDREAGLLQESS